MSTAGTPPSASPSSARTNNSACQLGRNATMIVSSDEAVSDSVINRCRLQPSETKPAIKIATASEAVVTDTDIALSAGLTPNALVNSGRSGCTQESSGKEE